MKLPFELMDVKVNHYLNGAKKAVKINGAIYVSPAMWDLMTHATPEELQVLLAEIGVIDMDEKQATLFITDKKPSDPFRGTQ